MTIWQTILSTWTVLVECQVCVLLAALYLGSTSLFIYLFFTTFPRFEVKKMLLWVIDTVFDVGCAVHSRWRRIQIVHVDCQISQVS